MTGLTVEALAVHALLTAALYYLAARAAITEPIWSRYPAWLDRVALCPACAGFWIGAALAAAGAAHDAWPWRAAPVLALTAVATAPILWGAMVSGFNAFIAPVDCAELRACETPAHLRKREAADAPPTP